MIPKAMQSNDKMIEDYCRKLSDIIKVMSKYVNYLILIKILIFSISIKTYKLMYYNG